MNHDLVSQLGRTWLEFAGHHPGAYRPLIWAADEGPSGVHTNAALPRLEGQR